MNALIPKNLYATDRNGKELSEDQIRLDENRVLRWIIQEGGRPEPGKKLPWSWPQIRNRCHVDRARSNAALARLIKTRRVTTYFELVLDEYGRRHRRLFLDWDRDHPTAAELTAWLGTTGAQPPPCLMFTHATLPVKPTLNKPPGVHRTLTERVLELIIRNPDYPWRDIAHACGRQSKQTRTARQELLDEGALVAQHINTRTRGLRPQERLREHYFPVETHDKVKQARHDTGIPWPGIAVPYGAEPAWQHNPTLRKSLPEAQRLRDEYDAKRTTPGKNIPTPSPLAPLGRKLPTLETPPVVMDGDFPADYDAPDGNSRACYSWNFVDYDNTAEGWQAMRDDYYASNPDQRPHYLPAVSTPAQPPATIAPEPQPLTTVKSEASEATPAPRRAHPMYAPGAGPNEGLPEEAYDDAYRGIMPRTPPAPETTKAPEEPGPLAMMRWDED